MSLNCSKDPVGAAMKTGTSGINGGCLCGHIRYIARSKPVFPHLCSCQICQNWSGAPTVAWVEFSLSGFKWTGNGGAPAYFKTSPKTQRAHCPKCGSNICAIDEGYENISIVMGSLDNPNAIVPDACHSYQSDQPNWCRVDIKSD